MMTETTIDNDTDAQVALIIEHYRAHGFSDPEIAEILRKEAEASFAHAGALQAHKRKRQRERFTIAV